MLWRVLNPPLGNPLGPSHHPSQLVSWLLDVAIIIPMPVFLLVPICVHFQTSHFSTRMPSWDPLWCLVIWEILKYSSFSSVWKNIAHMPPCVSNPFVIPFSKCTKWGTVKVNELPRVICHLSSRIKKKTQHRGFPLMPPTSLWCCCALVLHNIFISAPQYAIHHYVLI